MNSEDTPSVVDAILHEPLYEMEGGDSSLKSTNITDLLSDEVMSEYNKDSNVIQKLEKRWDIPQTSAKPHSLQVAD